MFIFQAFQNMSDVFISKYLHLMFSFQTYYILKSLQCIVVNQFLKQEVIVNLTIVKIGKSR